MHWASECMKIGYRPNSPKTARRDVDFFTDNDILEHFWFKISPLKVSKKLSSSDFFPKDFFGIIALYGLFL